MGRRRSPGAGSEPAGRARTCGGAGGTCSPRRRRSPRRPRPRAADRPPRGRIRARTPSSGSARVPWRRRRRGRGARTERTAPATRRRGCSSSRPRSGRDTRRHRSSTSLQAAVSAPSMALLRHAGPPPCQTLRMRYRTVLCDVGGTLIGPRQSFGEIYARVLGRHGLSFPAQAFESALRAEWDEMNRAIPAGADRYSHFPDGESGFWLRVVRGTIGRVTGSAVPDGLPGPVLDALRDAFRDRDAWEVFADVVPTLEALRGEGVRLGVVSNWDSRLPAVLERLELASYFDAVTVSSLAGVEKPDPRIFHHALRELGATTGTTLHVGDLPETDLAGAHAAGLRGVLVDRAGRLDPSLGALPDLRSLPALARDGALPVPD